MRTLCDSKYILFPSLLGFLGLLLVSCGGSSSGAETDQELISAQARELVALHLASSRAVLSAGEVVEEQPEIALEHIMDAQKMLEEGFEKQEEFHQALTLKLGGENQEPLLRTVEQDLAPSEYVTLAELIASHAQYFSLQNDISLLHGHFQELLDSMQVEIADPMSTSAKEATNQALSKIGSFAPGKLLTELAQLSRDSKISTEQQEFEEEEEQVKDEKQAVDEKSTNPQTLLNEMQQIGQGLSQKIALSTSYANETLAARQKADTALEELEAKQAQKVSNSLSDSVKNLDATIQSLLQTLQSMTATEQDITKQLFRD